MHFGRAGDFGGSLIKGIKKIILVVNIMTLDRSIINNGNT